MNTPKDGEGNMDSQNQSQAGGGVAAEKPKPWRFDGPVPRCQGPRPMTGVSLDTSGSVAVYPWEGGEIAPQVHWGQLSPFEQGYGGAMARELYDRLISEGWTHEAASQAVAFRNWDTETLEAIRKDCAAFVDVHPEWASPRANPPAGGDLFWKTRQFGFGDFVPPNQRAALAELFPPLTVTLGEDGKVRIAPVDGTTERSSRSGRTS